MDFSDIIALCALAVSLTLGLISLFQNRKLNKQQKQINAIILVKEEQEKNNQKRAIIEASSIAQKGSTIIKVYNKGNAIARNVRMKFPYDRNDGLLFRDPPFPYTQMNPKTQGTEFCINLVNGHIEQVIIKFIWDDEFANNNEITQILTI